MSGYEQAMSGYGKDIAGHERACDEDEHEQAGNGYGNSQLTNPYVPVADENGHPTGQFDDATGYESANTQGTSTYTDYEGTDEDTEGRPMYPNTDHANKSPVAHEF